MASNSTGYSTSYSSAADIRVAVIGYGGAFNMGRTHLEAIQAAGMTPQAVCELDQARLAIATEDFPGIETWDSVEAMLAGSQAELVIIITPHNTHAALASQCLQAGKHVVCEKPLAITTAECDSMIAAAAQAGVMLSTYHNRHWDGCVLEAVDRVVHQQAVGDVYKIDIRMGGYRKPGDWWRSSCSISGGILYDWGVHLLEYSLQLLPGRSIVEVGGFAHRGFWSRVSPWADDCNEDEARAVVRFDDGSHLVLTMSSLDPNPKAGLIEVTGTGGSYILDQKRFTLIQPQDEGEHRNTTGDNREGEQHRYYANIAAHLTADEALIITPEWSRRPIHIIDLAVQSAQQGRTLPARYA